MHCSIYAVILKVSFPKYPKKIKIQKHIEIPRKQKEKLFQLSVETIERMNTGIESETESWGTAFGFI
jgi:hypothetical protein